MDEPVFDCLLLGLKYAAACSVLFALAGVLSPLLFSEFRSFTKQNKLAWCNRTVSIFHSIVMFTRACYYWVRVNPTFEVPIRIGYFEEATMDIMVGYLLYDTVYELALGDGGLIIGHHVAGLISHLLGRSTRSGPSAFYL